jgi:hypothetical protein
VALYTLKASMPIEATIEAFRMMDPPILIAMLLRDGDSIFALDGMRQCLTIPQAFAASFTLTLTLKGVGHPSRGLA